MEKCKSVKYAKYVKYAKNWHWNLTTKEINPYLKDIPSQQGLSLRVYHNGYISSLPKQSFAQKYPGRVSVLFCFDVFKIVRQIWSLKLTVLVSFCVDGSKELQVLLKTFIHIENKMARNSNNTKS